MSPSGIPARIRQGSEGFLYGFPPKVIWLDVGNRTTDDIASLIEAEADSLARFEDSEESLLAITVLRTDP